MHRVAFIVEAKVPGDITLDHMSLICELLRRTLQREDDRFAVEAPYWMDGLDKDEEIVIAKKAAVV